MLWVRWSSLGRLAEGVEVEGKVEGKRRDGKSSKVSGWCRRWREVGKDVKWGEHIIVVWYREVVRRGAGVRKYWEKKRIDIWIPDSTGVQPLPSPLSTREFRNITFRHTCYLSVLTSRHIRHKLEVALCHIWCQESISLFVGKILWNTISIYDVNFIVTFYTIMKLICYNELPSQFLTQFRTVTCKRSHVIMCSFSLWQNVNKLMQMINILRCHTSELFKDWFQ